nr:hypothetical protein HK105_008087 [Polyrhizophydium stewartii]
MTLADALQTHAPTALAAAAVATAVYSLLEPLLDNGPPGPYSWPLIGALPQASSYLSRSAVHEFFDKVVKDHGPIVRVKLGMIGTMYLVSDAELARRILTSPEFVRSDGVVKIAGTLFALTGETWRIHRKMLQPAFGPLHLRHAISVAKEVAKELAEAWTAMIEASPDKEVVVDSHEYFKALTFDFIGKASFTHDFGAIQSVLRGESNQALDDYEKVSHILQSRFAVPQLFWRAAGIDPSSPAVIATRERIQGEIKAVVLERKKQMAANNGKPLRSGVEMDLLDRLLVSASDGTDVFNEDQISGEITGFFFAGHEYVSDMLGPPDVSR